MKADGSIIIDTRINTAGFGKGATNLKSQFGSLGSSVKKLGGLIAAAFSVKAIVAFSKEAIEMGSNLQEVQNVVDVTFTAMNERVNEFAKNADKTAGLSETMAKRYVGTFGAMAKSFQFTEEDAYNMSTALTQLAGDVASFYNITQDEAYTKLKSVFTGETESLKDLGVVMTQTALDDFALRKGLSKTTSEMTEQEKVALRYQFVMEQLAGASGDFLRTSDSWANQTRLLSLQFDQLKATVGQGLINALTPAIKAVNTLLEQFQKLADRFLGFTQTVFGDASDVSSGLADVVSGYEAATDSADSFAESTVAAEKTASKSLAGFDEITRLSVPKLPEAASEVTSEKTLEIENVSIGDVTLDSKVEDAITPQIQGIVDRLHSFFESLRDIDFSPLLVSLSDLGSSFFNFGSVIRGSLEWAWINILSPLAEWTIEEVAPAAIDVLSIALDVLGSVISALRPLVEWLWDTFLQPIAEWTGGVIVDVLKAISDCLKGVSDWIQVNQSLIETLIIIIGSFAAAWGLVNGALTAWNAIVAIWNNIGLIAAAVTTTFGAAVNFLTSPITLVVLAIGALIAVIVLLVKNWDTVKEVAANAWEKVKSVWNSVSNWFKTNVAEPIANLFESMVNRIIGFINDMISTTVSGVNFIIGALNKLRFDVPEWVPVIGGETFGFDIQPIKAPQIPYLAQGAVIPPNAPFMAVLGDQKHGTNIEAPEGLIRKIFSEEMSDLLPAMVAGFEEVAKRQEKILEAVLDVHVGDDVIGQAADRYNARMAIIRGSY